MIFVVRVFFVPVRYFCIDKFSLALACEKRRFYRFRNVLRIHIVQQISERCNVKRRSVKRVNIIVRGVENAYPALLYELLEKSADMFGDRRYAACRETEALLCGT